MKNPGIVLAGTNSGCGKTTISTGIMAALVKRGMKVQPFKVGPDYIDPMFHSFVTGRYSRNLDSWLLDEKTLVHLYCKNIEECDIAVVEGVMGFYDGFGGSSIEGSTAHVAGIIKCPVILVVNARGMSLSVAAMIKGFLDFNKASRVVGVILNKVNSKGLFTYLREIIEENTEVKVIGYVPESEDYLLPERHLGLVPDGEVTELRQKLNQLAEVIEKTIDIDLLLELAGEAEELCDDKKYLDIKTCKEKVKIAVAYDKAFNFYYRDNLDLLEKLGAELVYFSPVEDRNLPENIDGIYIGGGYPEVFGKELEGNLSIRQDFREALLNGLPAYAECGGLMYLCKELKDKAGNIFNMVGFFDAQSEMTNKLQNFGYVEVNFVKDAIIGYSGLKTKAHEFHYSVVKDTEVGRDTTDNRCFDVVKSRKSSEVHWAEGIKKCNTVGGYPHIHFWSNPSLPEAFVSNCIAARKSRKQDGLQK